MGTYEEALAQLGKKGKQMPNIPGARMMRVAQAIVTCPHCDKQFPIRIRPLGAPQYAVDYPLSKKARMLKEATAKQRARINRFAA